MTVEGMTHAKRPNREGGCVAGGGGALPGAKGYTKYTPKRRAAEIGTAADNAGDEAAV
jgi:hypothetical protein